MLRQIAKMNKTVPKALMNKPDVTEWLAPYINSFNALSNSRSIGMSAGFIPVSEIIAYAHAIGEPDVDEFIRIMQIADQAFMSSINKRKTKVTAPTKKR